MSADGLTFTSRMFYENVKSKVCASVILVAISFFALGLCSIVSGKLNILENLLEFIKIITILNTHYRRISCSPNELRRTNCKQL